MKAMSRLTIPFAALVFSVVVTAGIDARAARGVGAAAGAAYRTADVSCFSNSYGSVTNNASCSGAKTWLVSLPVDAAQAYNPTIWYSGQAQLAGGTVSCETATRNADGSSYGITGYVSAPNNASGSFQPGSETVPSNGFLWVACNIAGSGTAQPAVDGIVW